MITHEITDDNVSVGSTFDDPLDTLEARALDANETVIAGGLQSFIEVGMAFYRIREQRLYRTYGTFDDYCQQRWGFTDSRARQLILGATTAQHVETVTTVTLPNEHCARALRTFPADLQPAIAQIASAEAGAFGKPLTAGMIARVGAVIQQAARTGAVDVSGDATPLTAALTDEAYEAMMRQRVHIEQSTGGADGKKLKKVAECEARYDFGADGLIFDLDAPDLVQGKYYTVRVYEAVQS
jgi:hypothetical protein